MPRVALAVEYDGAPYHGWQRQLGQATVQGAVEEALSKVAAQPVEVVCAGRTDAGVHALGQTIHFDCEVVRPPHAWVRGGNTGLPPSVRLLWAQEVPESFHARFTAIARSYRYLIFNRAIAPATLKGKVSWEYRPLAVEPMAQAAKALLGRHDFSAFRDAQCQAKSPVREITELRVTRHSPHLLQIDVTANAFLHHMVRNIAGVLIAIGRGERPVGWAAEVLAGRKRALGGVTASPDGLYLVAAHYPQEFVLPEVPQAAWVW